MKQNPNTNSAKLYEKLLAMGWTKVLIAPIPKERPDRYWRFSDYNQFTLIKVGKRKSILRESFFPKTKSFSVANTRIVPLTEWFVALERWEKEKMWETLSKE